MSIQSIAMQASVAPATASVAPATNVQLPVRTASTEAPFGKTETISKNPVTATTAEQKQQLSAAVKAVKDFIQPNAGNLEFTMDEETGDTIIKIVDSSSGELIRQIPSKEMLEIAKALDRLQGLLVRQKV